MNHGRGVEATESSRDGSTFSVRSEKVYDEAETGFQKRGGR